MFDESQFHSASAAMGLLWVVVLFGIAIVIRLEVQSRKSGPYSVVFEKIEQCEDMGTNEMAWSSNLTKLENGLYRAGLLLKIPLDKNTKICVEGRELTPEGYTKVHQFNCKTCTQVWSIIGDFFINLMNTVGLPPEECNFPKGDYTINNWNASRSFRLVPTMPWNRFKFIVNHFNGKENIGCNIFYVEFVPK